MAKEEKEGIEGLPGYTKSSLNDNSILLILTFTLRKEIPAFVSISLEALAVSVFSYLSDR
jgi:hypothetical protein